MTLDPRQEAHHVGRTGPSAGDRTARLLALAAGIAFLLVGVLGFVPGVTTRYDELRLGHDSGAQLLGLFQVSGVHNVLHLLLGALGTLLARRGSSAVWYLIGGGAAYLGLWIYGLVVGHHSHANVAALNDADNWLHLGLGVAMLLLAVTLAGQHDPTKRRTRARG
jgi:hypothetical protein